MSDRHTDVEDLTQEDCEDFLMQLMPSTWCRSLVSERGMLRELTGLLDRTGADWPHIILGLEPTP